MINLILFILCFAAWLTLALKNKFYWYTYVLAFFVGAFFTQTILWLCGAETII